MIVAGTLGKWFSGFYAYFSAAEGTTIQPGLGAGLTDFAHTLP